MLLNIEDYRRLARRRLPRFVFDYVEGAADTESGARRNREALQRMALLPRCLRDTHALDTTVKVFGRTWPWPVAVAPTGFNGLVRPGGDILIARAAKSLGLTFVQSTASNARLEAVAEAAGPPWLQLYVMSERSIAEQIVRFQTAVPASAAHAGRSAAAPGVAGAIGVNGYAPVRQPRRVRRGRRHRAVSG